MFEIVLDVAQIILSIVTIVLIIKMMKRDKEE